MLQSGGRRDGRPPIGVFSHGFCERRTAARLRPRDIRPATNASRDVLKIDQNVFPGRKTTAVVLKIGQSVFLGRGLQAPDARARVAAPFRPPMKPQVRRGISSWWRAEQHEAGLGDAAAGPKSPRPVTHSARFSAQRPPSGCRKTHFGRFSAHDPADGGDPEGRRRPPRPRGGLPLRRCGRGASLQNATLVKTPVHWRMESRKTRLRGQKRLSLEANPADRPRIPARGVFAPVTSAAKPQFRGPCQEAWPKPALSVPTVEAGFDHGGRLARADGSRGGAKGGRRPPGARRSDAAATRGQPHETCTNRRRANGATSRTPATGATRDQPASIGDLWRFRKANSPVDEPWKAGSMNTCVHRPLTAALPQSAARTHSRRRRRRDAPIRRRPPAGRRTHPRPDTPPPPRATSTSEILRLRRLRRLRSG